MYEVIPVTAVHTVVLPSPDKSISHRALLIAAVRKGKTIIHNLLFSRDTRATAACLSAVGVDIFLNPKEKKAVISARGKYYPHKGMVRLFAHESGTTIRLISGFLAGQKYPSVIFANKGLRKRPMKRITIPLRMMGAHIQGTPAAPRNSKMHEEYPPLHISPVKNLRGIDYTLPVGSAQVKSAILFATLYAQGKTCVIEPSLTRDHTERMLSYFGAGITRGKNSVVLENASLDGGNREVFIPGDISSAAFFIGLGILLPRSEILLKGVGINPTRTGAIMILKRMGAQITFLNKEKYFEPSADILVRSSQLRGTVVSKREIPALIDEVPILLVCAAFAQGETIIKGVKELTVKETDRIHSMAYNLKRAGVCIEAYPDKADWCIRIRGKGFSRKTRRRKLTIKSFNDHRTAMSMIIFSLASGLRADVDDIQCIHKSFPEFITTIESLSRCSS